jgi:excisionase family DNA binding protein
VGEAEDTYTTGQAARILDVSDRYIRKLIAEGELEAVRDEGGRHRIPQRAVHAMLEVRRREEALDADTREHVSSGDPPGSRQELRDLRRRVEELQRELGRLEGRLELTEKTESSMAEERERLIEALEDERYERRRLQERLEEKRTRPWYRRWFR